MFSGPVTTMTSMPALARSARARATRPSYSCFGNADSEPCWTPSLAISVVSNKLGCGGVEGDAEARGTLRMDRPGGVEDARNRIIDEPVSSIELGEFRHCRAGDVQRRRGGSGPLVHLTDHEGHASLRQFSRGRNGWRNAAQLHELEVR